MSDGSLALPVVLLANKSDSKFCQMTVESVQAMAATHNFLGGFLVSAYLDNLDRAFIFLLEQMATRKKRINSKRLRYPSMSHKHKKNVALSRGDSGENLSLDMAQSTAGINRIMAGGRPASSAGGGRSVRRMTSVAHLSNDAFANRFADPIYDGGFGGDALGGISGRSINDSKMYEVEEEGEEDEKKEEEDSDESGESVKSEEEDEGDEEETEEERNANEEGDGGQLPYEKDYKPEEKEENNANEQGTDKPSDGNDDGNGKVDNTNAGTEKDQS